MEHVKFIQRRGARARARAHTHTHTHTHTYIYIYIHTHTHTWADHLIPGLIFFPRETTTRSEVATNVPIFCKCMCKIGGRYLPAIALWKPFSERLPAVCVASHDGG